MSFFHTTPVGSTRTYSIEPPASSTEKLALHQIIYRLIIQGVSLLKIKLEEKVTIKQRLALIVDAKQSILKNGWEV